MSLQETLGGKEGSLGLCSIHRRDDDGEPAASRGILIPSAKTRGRRRTILTLLACLVALLCYGRLYFGVDLTDESFYAAVPYEYVLGNQPYVDEMCAFQSFGLITYPLVRGYFAVASSEGLILALRHAYFLLVVGVALLSSLLLRRVVGSPWLLAAGLGYMSLVPLSLPSLSYNTLGAGFLTCGFIFGLNYLLASHAWRMLVAAGVCHGLAAMAYPPLLLVLIVHTVVLCALLPNARMRAILPYCLGALVVLGGCGIIVVVIGPGNVLHALSVNGDMGSSYAGGAPKLWEMFVLDPGRWAVRVAPAMLLAIVAIVAGRKRKTLGRWCTALVPVTGLCLVATGEPPFNWATFFIVLLALYSWLVVLCQLEPSHSRRCLVLWGLLPALCAGAVTSYSSSRGFDSAWVGLAPTVLIACIATGLTERQSAPQLKRIRPEWLRFTPVVAVLVAGLLFQWVGVYRDHSVPHLTACVQAGPYRGLLTTPERRDILQALATDIDATTTSADRVMYLPGAPWVYLLSTAQPAGPSVWLPNVETDPDGAIVGAWLEETGRTPTVVISLKKPQTEVRREVSLWGELYEAALLRDAYGYGIYVRRAHAP